MFNLYTALKQYPSIHWCMAEIYLSLLVPSHGVPDGTEIKLLSKEIPSLLFPGLNYCISCEQQDTGGVVNEDKTSSSDHSGQRLESFLQLGFRD